MLACSKFMGRASACSGGLEVFGLMGLGASVQLLVPSRYTYQGCRVGLPVVCSCDLGLLWVGLRHVRAASRCSG